MSRYDTRREKGEEHLVQSPVREKTLLLPSRWSPGALCPPATPDSEHVYEQGHATGAARRYAPPADGSSIQKSRRIYVRLRTGPQSAHLWWPALAKLQAASVPIVWAWDRQTDGSRYSKMPPKEVAKGGSVAEWLACWTQAQKGPGSNRSRDAVG